MDAASHAPLAPSGRFRVTVVSPVYRDWASASVLCRALDEACARLPDVDVRVLFVDDGSPDGLAGWESFEPARLRGIEVLRLRRNLGHQKAIAAALCHVASSVACDAVVVMDADGEDRPEDAIRLVEDLRAGSPRIVFARRRRRLESSGFQAGYHAYRLLHRILTGVPVRVGNFSVVPHEFLGRLTCMPELWNHYVGAVFRSRLPFEAVPMDRGRRYRGASHMDLIALVNHGLAGIASFHDVVATRLLLGAGAGMVLVVAALAGVIFVRFGTDLAIPGWATSAAGLLLLLFAQLVATTFSLVFMLIASRTNQPFVPARDHGVFVDRVETLWSPR